MLAKGILIKGNSGFLIVKPFDNISRQSGNSNSTIYFKDNKDFPMASRQYLL